MKFKNRLQKCFDAPFTIPLLLLIVGAVFFPVRGTVVSPDSVWYLSTARKMYEQISVDTYIIWRPFFPFLMSIMFRIFDVSVESGFFVVRIFFVLNIILTYLFGKFFYNKKIGLIFSFLIITSFQINILSSRLLLDNVIAFFVLAFILAVCKAFERGKRKYFFLSGLFLIFGFLTKPSFVLLYMTFPLFFLFFSKYRNKKILKGLLFLYGTFLLLLMPWIISVINGRIELHALFGAVADSERGYGVLSAISANLGGNTSFFVSLSNSLFRSLQNYIYDRFILFPLFFLGIVFSIFQVGKEKRLKRKPLIWSFVLFLPIAFLMMIVSYRAGQLMILYFFLFLFASVFLLRITSYVLNKYKKIRPLEKTFYIVVIGTCIIVQIFVGKGLDERFASLFDRSVNSSHNSFSFCSGDFKSFGLINSEVEEMGDWIEENVSWDSKIAGQKNNIDALSFLVGDDYSFYEIENVRININDFERKDLKNRRNPICVWANDYMSWVYAIYEEDMLKQINDDNVNYVLVPTKNRRSLNNYFLSNSNYSFVKTFNDNRIKIYRVNKHPVQRRSVINTRFSFSIYNYFSFLYKNNKEEYEDKKAGFKSVLNFDEKWFDSFFETIEESDEKKFKTNYQLLSLLLFHNPNWA